MTKITETNYNAKDILKKKQWSKYVSKGIALSLMHYNKKSPLFKSYKNSSYCAEILLTDENSKINTMYCKNRWCLTCNRIKTARLINNYLPELQKLFNPVFLTLTLPTVNADGLKSQISHMEASFRKIYNNTKQGKYLKNHSPLKGIRKAECTIRPDGLYHYHFHLILDNWAQGEWVLGQWLKVHPAADSKAQDLRFANEFAFKELFKYSFKAEVKTDNFENAQRYDVVFQALRGKKTYFCYGIKAIEEEFSDEDLKNSIVLENKPNHTFCWAYDDWYDRASGEALVNLAIPEKVKNLTNYPKR